MENFESFLITRYKFNFTEIMIYFSASFTEKHPISMES